MSHRNANAEWYAYWSKPTIDYNDNKEVWMSYIVYPSSQRGIFEPYTGHARDLKEFRKLLREHQNQLVTVQAHDDLHN